jgi:transposase
LIDGTVIRAHQHSAGAQGGQEKQGLGRSVGGFSSKLHFCSDSKGNPNLFLLTAGQEHDVTKAHELTKNLPTGSSLAADKGYDSSDLRISLLTNNIEPLIPSRSNRIYKPPYDKEKYKIRHMIECFFSRLKQYRAIATRYDKLASTYLSCVAFICAIICIKT